MTAQHVIKAINSKMSIDVKEIGQIECFNGVDIAQTQDYIKISNATFILIKYFAATPGYLMK